MFTHCGLEFLNLVWVLIQLIQDEIQVLYLGETLVVLCEVQVCALCLLGVLVEHGADVVEET